MQITSQLCACDPCGLSANPDKAINQKVRSTAHIHLLMVLLVMGNVALVVIAANYSQQSHPCKSLTVHSFKGTTDTQLTTSESLSTRP